MSKASVKAIVEQVRGLDDNQSGVSSAPEGLPDLVVLSVQGVDSVPFVRDDAGNNYLFIRDPNNPDGYSLIHDVEFQRQFHEVADVARAAAQEKFDVFTGKLYKDPKTLSPEEKLENEALFKRDAEIDQYSLLSNSRVMAGAAGGYALDHLQAVFGHVELEPPVVEPAPVEEVRIEVPVVDVQEVEVTHADVPEVVSVVDVASEPVQEVELEPEIEEVLEQDQVVYSLKDLDIKIPDSAQNDFDAGELYYAAENAVEAIRDGKMSSDNLELVRAGMEAFGEFGAGYMGVIDDAFDRRADWAQVGGAGDRTVEGAFLDRLAGNRDAHMETFKVVRDEARLQALLEGLDGNKYTEDDNAYVRLAAYGRIGYALQALESNLEGAVSGDYGDLCALAIDVDQLSDGLIGLKDELQDLEVHIEGFRGAKIETGATCDAPPKL